MGEKKKIVAPSLKKERCKTMSVLIPQNCKGRIKIHFINLSDFFRNCNCVIVIFELVKGRNIAKKVLRLKLHKALVTVKGYEFSLTKLEIIKQAENFCLIRPNLKKKKKKAF